MSIVVSVRNLRTATTNEVIIFCYLQIYTICMRAVRIGMMYENMYCTWYQVPGTISRHQGETGCVFDPHLKSTCLLLLFGQLIFYLGHYRQVASVLDWVLVPVPGTRKQVLRVRYLVPGTGRYHDCYSTR